MANVLSKIGSIFGGAASAASPVGQAATIIDGAKGIIGMFKLDPTKKAELEAQLTLANLDVEKAALVGQLEIDKQEAASQSKWVSGWRPFIGWICGCALAWEFVLKPFLQFILIASGHPLTVALPALDTATLIAGLLAPMLGLGGLRTYEKVQGAPGADKLQ